MDSEHVDREPDAGAASSGEFGAGEDVAAQLFAELAALRAFVGHFLSATADEAGIRARRILIKVAIGLVGAMLALIMACAFVIYLVRGIDGGLTAATGRAWLGHLLTGVLGLGLPILLFSFFSWRKKVLRRQRTMEKYERQRAEQREQFGYDVDGAIRAAG